MNAVLFLTIGSFVVLLLCGVIYMPMAIKQKTPEAVKGMRIAGCVLTLASFIVMILAIVMHGEPVLAFAIPEMIILLSYFAATYLIIEKCKKK